MGILQFCCFVFITLLGSCQPFNPAYKYEGEKIKGLSFVATPQPIGIETLQQPKEIGAKWLSLMPYGFARTADASFIYQDEQSTHKQYWGETPQGIAACIRMAHQQGFKVMVKPHVWLHGGTFTGDMDFGTESEWQKFEAQYARYILRFAKVADSLHAEAFCIGTELKTFVKKRPQFWFQLIKDVKKVYQGKLTYAENWDSYQQVPFWKDLDFVGIDAYFPLSEEKSPSTAIIRKGWKSTLKDLEKFSRKHQKPILFTEIGYRSVDYATMKPWDSSTDYPPNEILQAGAYEALFQEVWQQEWFAGAFIWKWFPTMSKDKSRDKFSPQRKGAEAVLRKYWE